MNLSWHKQWCRGAHSCGLPCTVSGTYRIVGTYGFTVMVNVDVVFWMLT